MSSFSLIMFVIFCALFVLLSSSSLFLSMIQAKNNHHYHRQKQRQKRISEIDPSIIDNKHNIINDLDCVISDCVLFKYFSRIFISIKSTIIMKYICVVLYHIFKYLRINSRLFIFLLIIIPLINNLPSSKVFAQFINNNNNYNSHLRHQHQHADDYSSASFSSSSSSAAALNFDHFNDDQINDSNENDDDQTVYPKIRALLGKNVGLPCNISQSETNSIKLILWFRNDSGGTPIYTVDARDTQNLSLAKHFLDISYRKRASFEINPTTRTALLIINPIVYNDDGHYICRVDYRWTRTKISNIRLEVIVPPLMIQIVQSYQYQPEIIQSKMGVNHPHGIYHPLLTTNINNNNNTFDMNRKSFEKNFYHLVQSNIKSMTNYNINNINQNKLNESLIRQYNSDINLDNQMQTSTLVMNENVIIVKQPESSILTLSCDSIGGKPMSMIKWYRLMSFENVNLTDAQLYTLLQSSEKSMQLIDDSYYPMVLPLSSNIPRLLLNAINNQTFRNSFDTMMNTNDDNDNDNNNTIAFDSKLDEIKTTIENKSKNNRMNPTTIEELFYENKNIFNNNNNNNGSDVMRKISIVRNDLNIGKISIDNHGQLYLCRTTNTNLTRSIDIIIRLEVFAGPKSVQIKQLLHEQDKQFHQDVYFNANSDNKNNLIMTEMSSNNRTWHSIELLDHYLQHHGSLNDAVKIVQSSSTTVDEQSEILKASKIDISKNLNNNNQWTHAKKSFRIRSGYEFEFTCQANGSLPNVKIFWYLQDMNTNHLRNITESSNIYQNGNNAISYLRIVPQYTDNNAKLICQAYNQEMLYELIMSLRKQKWTNDTYPFGQIVSSGTFSLSSSSSSSSLQPENNDINENLVNFLLTDIILNNDKLQQQQQQHQQQYFHHHYHHHQILQQQQHQQKQQESVIAKNILEQFYYYHLKHYPYQLHTTVYLDVNYKPIIVIKVLSGEQMYKEVSSSSSSSTFNSNQINNDNNNINDDDQDQQQRTTIKSTIIEQQQQHSFHHNHNHHYYRFKEMSEIFFNCSINSNPDAHLIEWFMNEKLIHTEITKGIIITNNNRTLIISPLQRRSSGIYYCVAANILGKTVSDRVQIDILFKPQCQVEFVQTYYQHLDDYVQLKCHIIANPNENVQFTWRFNDSIFIGDINGAYSSSSSSETFIDHLSVIQDSRSSSSSIEDVFVVDQALINQKNRQNIRQMLPRTKSSSIHTNIDNKYLITNIIKIRLKKWSSFGHFTCTAKNEIGLQNEPCRWQLIPHHHHQHYRNNYQSHLNNNNNPHHHLYHKHHFHHQDQENSQSLITSSSPSLSRLPNQLNNCHIIESSNAVVIKCSNGVELYEHDVDNTKNSNMELMMLNGNNSENYFSSEFSDDDSALSAFKVRPLLTYHVQVFRLSSNINGNNNYNNDSNMKSLQNFLNNENENTPNENDETNDEKKSSEQKYFQQKSIPDLNISNQPESKKQIASIHGSSLTTQTSTFKPLISSEKKSSSSSSTNDPVLIMDTLNFTNPLFIITNLTSSTSYLLRIWSSKQHMYDSMIEQVNITVRTKPDDKEFDNGYSNNIDGDRSRIKQRKSMKIFHNLLTMLSFNGDDISSLFLFIFIIFIISLFLIIIVIYFVRKITHIHRNHKDKKRGLNTKRKNNDNNETNNLENSNNLYENEKQSTATINVLETALCEMRPETLENDLKYKNSSTTPACSTATLTAITSPYSAILDTFKPYNINNNENDHQKYRQQHFQLNENLSSASSSKTTATTATAASSSSSALIIKCDLPESSIITYQNYLFPMTSNESSTVNVTATTATATSSTATLIATNEGHIANLMANTGANTNTNNNNNNNGACISIDSTNVFNEINVLDSVITAASNNSHSHMANYTPTEFAMNMNDSITATSSMLHHQSHQHHQQQNYNHLQDLIHNHYQHQYDHCNNSISNTNNNHHHHQQQQQQQQCFDHSNVINDDNDNNNNNNDGSNIMNSSGVGHIGFDDNNNNNNNNNKNSGESFLLSSNSFQYPLSVRIVPTNINDTAAATATAAVAISQQFDTGSSSTPTTTTDIISMSYNNNNDHNNNNNISNSNENVCTNNKNNSINKIHTLV